MSGTATIRPGTVANRPPAIELMAEGLWRIACGESCPDVWDDLPEVQKVWWRENANAIIHDWRDNRWRY